ncbi:tannase and feruloyl esterase [Penicillium canescens]|nr:tannase and feruloyl esterase [Penicillium canescens]KAJ6175566.1 tannase and feruloyl esterase [Penicillium canescens]
MGLEDSFTWQDLDDSTVQLADNLNPGNATADTFNIGDFHKRCGMFLHHGLSDAPVSPDTSIYYYDQASSAVEPQGIEMNNLYCLFLIPEMDDDGLAENGTAPNEHAATKWENDATADEILRQHPICRYLDQAKYNCKGNQNDAGSWTCSMLY